MPLPLLLPLLHLHLLLLLLLLFPESVEPLPQFHSSVVHIGVLDAIVPPSRRAARRVSVAPAEQGLQPDAPVGRARREGILRRPPRQSGAARLRNNTAALQF